MPFLAGICRNRPILHLKLNNPILLEILILNESNDIQEQGTEKASRPHPFVSRH